jgi:hypothetical protein
MRIESDEGFVSLLADTAAEEKLLKRMAEAINAGNPDHPAQMLDGVGLIRAMLQIRIS